MSADRMSGTDEGHRAGPGAAPPGGCPMPLTRQRIGLDVADELTRQRDSGQLGLVTTAFGQEATALTRYRDVRAQLADADAFSVAAVPPLQTLLDAGLDPDEIRRR